MAINIADEAEIKKRNKELSEKRIVEIAELKKLLEQKIFRNFMYRLLDHTKTFHTIWEQSARIHYNAGQQDIGHFLMGQCLEADEESLFQMMRENQIKKEEKPNV